MYVIKYFADKGLMLDLENIPGERSFPFSKLTFNVRKGAECPPRAVAGVLDVIAFCGFVDFRVELLFRPRVAVLAVLAGLARHGVAPFVACLHLRTGRGSRERTKEKKRGKG